MSVVSASLPSTNSSSLPQSLTAAAVESEEHNHRLTTFWKSVIIALTIAGILVTMNQVFFWNLFNMAVLTNAFLYMLTACFVPIVFIVQPLRKATAGERPGVPWYDVLFLLAFMGCAGFFAFHGVDIAEFGWAFVSPASATVISYIFWALIV